MSLAPSPGWRASLTLLAIAVAALPIWYWDAGLIEKESTHFVRQYLDGRSLPQKVFDPHANDIGTYQARELSYFIDYVDATVLAALLDRGAVLLLPLSAVVAAALTVVSFSTLAPRAFPLIPPLTAVLALLLYLTNHIYSVTTAVFYRSAKPLLTPLILTALLFFAYVLRQSGAQGQRGQRARAGLFLATFALGCAMSLLDRQGFFYTVAMTAALAIWHRARGNARECVWGGVAAVVAMVLYNVVVGPWLIAAINGYRPSFEYQRVDVLHLVGHPLHFIQSIRLISQSAQIMLGSFPLWLYAGIAAVAIGSTWRRTGKPPVLVWRPGQATAGARVVMFVAASQVLMFALMIVRHPPIWDNPDHQLWYYPLPFQALVVFGVLLAVERLIQRRSGPRLAAVNLVFVAMIAGNLLSWPGHRRVMLSSPWFPEIHAQSTLLKQALQQRSPVPGLTPDYQLFYDFWKKEKAPGSVPRVP